MKSPYEKLKLISSLYPYNSLIEDIITGNLKRNRDHKSGIQGFFPLPPRNTYIVLDDSTAGEVNARDCNNAGRSMEIYPTDTTTVRIYTAFIDDCLKAGVKVLVVCSPFYNKLYKPDYSISIAEEIAKKRGVPFLCYLQDTFFLKHPELFYDIPHLNEAGAEIFSQRIINDMDALPFLIQ
jgi:hypothetical protein